MSNILDIFSKNLRLALAASNLTIEVVAQKMDVNYTTAQAWTSGKRLPKHDDIEMLAKLVGVDALSFFSSEDTHNKQALTLLKTLVVQEQPLPNCPSDIYERLKSVDSKSFWDNIRTYLDVIDENKKSKKKTSTKQFA